MSTNNQTNGGSKPKLSNEQKQKLKKYAVFALMGIICAGSMWLIFAPSADEKAKQEQTAGFNADIPMPKEEGIIDNKKDACEQEQMKRKQEERIRSLSDFTAMLGGDSEAQTPQDDLVLLDSEPAKTKTTGTGAGTNVSGKTAVIPVGQVREQTVSSLAGQNMSNADFIEAFGQPRNMGFLTATAGTSAGTKNTIFTCIHSDQTIMSGQSVRLRLLEPLRAGNMIILRNTVMSGTAKIQGERLEITVHSLENDGTILPIELTVYDLDGQKGIFIPNLQELNAAKEIAAFGKGKLNKHEDAKA